MTTSNSAYAWSNPLSSTVTSTFDGLNRKTGYTYDASGNETSDGTRTFAYDGENHLVSVTSVGSSFSLAYDALGRLAQTTASGTATNYLYDGDALAGEYSSAGTLLRQYMDGPDTDEPLLWSEGSGFTDLRHLHADRQGSIIAYSNASAASQATYTYGPYGEPNAWGGSRYRYTGQIELPEVSLYYYKARVYDPVAGRFLQTDPVEYKDDTNLYAYTHNDPMNHTDPTGELCIGSFPNQSFCDRSARYAALASDPSVNSRTSFFSAATIVTSALADAAAVSSPAQRAFLEQLSGQLEQKNISFLSHLSGRDIEKNNHDFVRFEQGNVQVALEQLQKSNPALYAALINDINANLNSNWLGAANSGLNPTFQSALLITRIQLGGFIDFAKLRDRVALGDNELAASKPPGPKDCPTGSRLC